MAEPFWKPVDAEDDGFAIQITYVNETGKEHIHAAELWGIDIDSSIAHTLCWNQCSGDWPGCRNSCPLFTGPVADLIAREKEYEVMPPYDPFSFMLNHYCEIDDHNTYVESFDTLDGVHWEVSVDVNDKLLEMLDEETVNDDGDTDGLN